MEGKEEEQITFRMVSGREITMTRQEYEALQCRIEQSGKLLRLTETRESEGG